jgi:hypothetical protein
MPPATLPRRKSTKTGRTEKKVTVSPLMPHYAHSMLEKHSYDNVHAEGWIGEKTRLVTIDTGASMTITTGLPERDPPTWCGIRVDPPHLEASLRKTESGTTPTNNLSVRRQYQMSSYWDSMTNTPKMHPWI